MTAADTTPDHVLYIAPIPLTAMLRESLRAVGVGVECLTSEQVEAGLRSGEHHAALRERIMAARICVLGQGSGFRVAGAVLQQRFEAGRSTWVTSRDARQFAEGMGFGSEDHSRELHRFVKEEDLLRALMALGERRATGGALAPAAGRPPFAAPYIADPTAYSTNAAAGGGQDERYERFREGRLSARDLVYGTGYAAAHYPNSKRVLAYLIRHTPTDDLDILAAPRLGEWWLAARAAWGGDNVAGLMAEAIARDGGGQTLAALPRDMWVTRDGVLGLWDGVIQRAGERLALECVSAKDCQEVAIGSIDDAARRWPTIPCEDPLAPDTDRGLFRPTLTTLRIARRYRSAPEVLREAHARWGGRPYMEAATLHQVKLFVQESLPSGAGDIDAWVRLLTSLPEGRLVQRIRNCIRWEWPRIEIPIANAIGNSVPTDRIPCFDAEGDLRLDLLAQVTNPEVANAIRAEAHTSHAKTTGRRG